MEMVSKLGDVLRSFISDILGDILISFHLTGRISDYFGKWIQSQENMNVEPLEARYNQKISLLDEKEIYDG